jgi:CHAT domain-containing protein
MKSIVGLHQSPEALTRIANVLKRDHADRWLADFLRASPSNKGNVLLLAAMEANQQGDSIHAFYVAKRALRIYRASGNLAGAYRSEFELIYALRRQSKAKACASEAAPKHPEYLWITVQIEIEHAACQEMIGYFDKAQHLSARASIDADRANYADLLLRVYALQASLHSAEGRTELAWTTDMRGLEQFWARTSKSERGFQFHSDLELLAEEAGQWHLAVALQREAVSFIGETNRPDFLAMALVHLGAALITAGYAEQGSMQIERADHLFEQLPLTAATRFYRASASLSLVKQQLLAGDGRAAANRLEQLRPDLEAIQNLAVRIPYETESADVERIFGREQQESMHLRSAAKIAEQGFLKLHSEKDRWEWRKQVDGIYRRLVEIKMKGPHDPEEALADWEAVRVRESLGPKTLAWSFDDNVVARSTLHAMLSAQHHSTLIAFGSLAEKTVVWIADDRGVKEVDLALTSSALKRQTHRFRALCSDPSTAVKKVNEVGSRLYRMLLSPIEQLLDPKRALVIEADDDTAETVWPALRTNGAYFGALFPIVSTPGLLFSTGSPVERRIGGVSFAYPGPVVVNGSVLPPLSGAERELEYVKRAFPTAIELKGPSVTLANVLGQLKTTSLFHFAGHALNRGYGGELAIYDDTGAGDSISASHLMTLRFSKLRLVVLSACSTAAGNEDATRAPEGLPRAFLRTGATYVLATRWEVDSSATNSIMEVFYREFGKTLDPAKSLRAAVGKDEIQSQHPYYWAGMQLFAYDRR